ncbi:aldehyde dehydrogenase family protein [Thermopolyspora sp. NPDC052614]|uniref:aldehyde dehydrogenase family protein n=1 Tax=Thermopolyspora sp. NPDC052614 TaxID=3155682 RepID=UPI003429D142
MRRLHIGGSWVRSTGGGGIDVVNPATEQVIDRVPAGTPADVDDAVAAARAAFPAWAATPPADRGKILAMAAVLLAERAERVARAIATDGGVPYGSALEVQTRLPLLVLRRYAELAERHPFEIDAPWEPDGPGRSLTVREPAGVVGAITPWRHPLHHAICAVAPALAAGCTVVLKPSAVAPLAAYELTAILRDSGLPPGVLNLVSGSGPVVGQAIAAHPRVDLVCFSGSAATGRRVAALAAGTGVGAGTVKRVVLDLGGKPASVILPDADLPAAVRASVGNAFVNSGRTRSAWTRLLVHRDQYDQAVRLAVEAAGEHPVGDPFAEGTRLGPLASAALRERVIRYINRGEEEGARLVRGGTEPPLERGYYIEPTVFAGVEPGMAIEREEIPGPVLVIVPFRDEDEAVEIVNGAYPGASGAVWAGDEARATAVARRLRAGQVHVNGARPGPAPFCGHRRPGGGREPGVAALEEYLQTKTLHL